MKKYVQDMLTVFPHVPADFKAWLFNIHTPELNLFNY